MRYKKLEYCMNLYPAEEIDDLEGVKERGFYEIPGTGIYYKYYPTHSTNSFFIPETNFLFNYDLIYNLDLSYEKKFLHVSNIIRKIDDMFTKDLLKIVKDNFK